MEQTADTLIDVGYGSAGERRMAVSIAVSAIGEDMSEPWKRIANRVENGRGAPPIFDVGTMNGQADKQSRSIPYISAPSAFIIRSGDFSPHLMPPHLLQHKRLKSSINYFRIRLSRNQDGIIRAPVILN